MISINKYPILSFQTPHTSESLLEDNEINEFLMKYYDNSCLYLTYNSKAIQERNQVLKHFLENYQLLEPFIKLYENICSLKDMTFTRDSDAKHILSSISIFEEFYSNIKLVCKTIDECNNIHKHFVKLSSELKLFLDNISPSNFNYCWDRFASGLALPRSLTYRFFFDDYLRISSITLVGAYNHIYRKATLFQTNSNGKIQFVDNQLSLPPSAPSDESKLIEPNPKISKLMHLSRNINRTFTDQMISAQRLINSKISTILNELNVLYQELHFYINSIKLIQDITSLDLPLQFAQVNDIEDKVFCANKIYHICLAQRDRDALVFNNIDMEGNDKILLIGGINRGGKTTFLQSCCCIQILFQMGLPVPAAKASLSPCISILCAFSKNEAKYSSHGKLGQELIVIQQALSIINEYGFFVFNEPISATSPHESYLLSKKVLCILKEKCARGIWVTHLYKIFDDLDDINEFLEGSNITSMYACSEVNQFKIMQGTPEKDSKAKRILFQYIKYD